jgi:hypothetical protein
LVAVSSQQRTTSVIELEDPWIEASGGRVHPELWVVYRPRYRGGWILPAGQSLSIPVVPGGNRFDLIVDLREISTDVDDAVLEIRSGQDLLKRRPLNSVGKWTWLRVGDLPWNGDGPLVLAIRRRDRDADPEVLLDRARLVWQ